MNWNSHQKVFLKNILISLAKGPWRKYKLYILSSGSFLHPSEISKKNINNKQILFMSTEIIYTMEQYVMICFTCL